MNASSSPATPSSKRAALLSWVKFIFYVLRMFWITWLTLLAAVVFGLFKGWATSDQWGEGVFYAGAAQVLIAGVAMVSSSREADDSAEVRYVSKGNVNDTFAQLYGFTERLENFGLRAFIGGVLTILATLLF